ncbi:hypothetical protein P171DRAFT_483329 [Karstenula rhodostoma CBS 690.94]|uniref:Azaphilone pigments biosynthesis cluster protein L N-terminal domain-containing protein n=1 Tax=Karstenula rhodostoma CBS 690.94 TaxID=1392251 RepID=A0A9P4PQ14_9PLEO|nr:hypothetical protein P171DRAFT_483329 [Karstenula rhodostoma CBS 690.94]
MSSNQRAGFKLSSASSQPLPLPYSIFFITPSFPFNFADAMADPLSVGGSAVGVVSLGLVVCKELHSFISDVRTAADKAEDIRANLESLENHLERLETELGKLDPTTSTAAASADVVVCVNALNRIKQKLASTASGSGSIIRQRLRSIKFHLSYPFKTDDLDYLRSLLKNIRDDLHLALQTVNLEQNRMNTETLRNHISHETRLVQRTVVGQQRILESTIDSQFSQQTYHIQGGFQDVGSETSLIRTEISQLRSTIEPVASRIFDLSRLEASLSRLQSRIDHLDPVNIAQRASHSDFSGAQRLNRTLKSYEHTVSQARRKVLSCGCRTRTSSVEVTLWSAVLSSTVTNSHASGCPYSAFGNALTDIDLRISLCSTLLRRKFTLAMGVSRSLMKGIAIRAGLRAITIVGENSEAFSLITEYTYWENSELYQPGSWDIVAAKLHKLFGTRRASPHDRLRDGRTILHHLCHRQKSVGTDVESPTQLQTVVDNLRCLASYLLEHMEGTAHVTDNSGKTCLELCTVDRQWSPFITQLLEHDVSISARYFDDFVVYGSKGLRQHSFYGYEHLIEISDTYIAIIFKDASRFSELLSNGQALQDQELEILNLYEMAVAMSWTEGFGLLIKNRVRLRRTESGLFKSVVRYCDIDLLRFWLNIRPSLDPSDLKILGALELALDYTIETEDSEKIDAVIDALARQRRDLEALAVKHLCEADYSPDHDRLLDLNAWTICDILEDQGVEVPPALIPSRTSIYYFENFPRRNLNTGVLDALYKAGFKDLSKNDQLDASTTFLTPLIWNIAGGLLLPSSWNNIPIPLSWFLAKGLDLDELWPNSHTKGSHLLAWLVGRSVYREELARIRPGIHSSPNFYAWISIPTTSTQVVAGVVMEQEEAQRVLNQEVDEANLRSCIIDALADETSDLCECHCSPSGCIPMSLLFRSLKDDGWYYSSLQSLDIAVQAVAKRILPFVLTSSNNRHKFTIAIRIIIFWKLEIRHTCCDLDRFSHRLTFKPESIGTCKPEPLYSPKDTKRIHNEDRHLIDVLEKLVPELDQAYDDLGLPFDDFVYSHMLPRIDEELEKLAKDDEQFAEGRRALGVIMESLPGHVSDEEVESGSEGGEDQESSDED